MNCNVLNSYLDYKTNYFESVSEFIDRYSFNYNKFFSIFCCNIRSINAHFDEFIMYMSVENNHLDVIILTETWHTIENCNYRFPGYRLYMSSIKRNQNDGIMVFIRENIKIEMHEYKHYMPNILKLNFRVNNNQLNILCVYRSPSGDINEFLTTFDNILKAESKVNGYVMIIGDLNINIVGTKSINNEYFDMLSGYGFKSFIKMCIQEHP